LNVKFVDASRNQKVKDRDTINVENEMYDFTSNNLGHQNCNNGVNRYLEAKPGTHSIDSLQKVAILGTLHIIQKVLQSET
jgi:hypothetical protein